MKKVLLLLPFLLSLLAAPTAIAQKKLKAAFTTPAGKLEAPAKIAFTNKSTGATAYEWDFGDSTKVDTSLNPMHAFKHSGNYTVTLKARKGKKISTAKQMIQVTAPERCLVEIETPFGTMLAELYASTPKHRDNFLKLADEGFYDDLLFHRVINGFMIQGGDPQSRGAAAGQMLGMGGPSYQVPAEFVDGLAHVKGAIAAARTNNPEKKSSGSQFYIVHGSPVQEATLNQVEAMRNFRYTPEQRKAYLANGGTPHLDREYTVYGQVIEGLDVIDKIAAVQTAQDRPKEDVKMKVRVIR
ncbi:MAG: peptidylprolyl isomerase [Saprospiraceae bacterium]